MGAREELRKVDWEEILSGTVNDDWEKLKDILFEIQRKFVPVVKGKRKNKKLWLTYKALKHVESKHRVFRKYKDSRHPACKRASAKASRQIKKAKYNFERKLAENIKSDSKSFFAYVRGSSNAASKLGPLVNSEGEVIDSVKV